MHTGNNDSVQNSRGEAHSHFLSIKLEQHTLLVSLALLVMGLLASALWLFDMICMRDRQKVSVGISEHDATTTDPGILQRYSTIKSYNVESTGFSYPGIRTFYRPHLQADKLPSKPFPLPLIVCIHGLGGSVAQFGPLLASLVCAPCLSIDLPGCGRSDFAPTNWTAYTTESLVQLLVTVIEAYRDVENSQGIVFIGHSMGCSLAALLASRTAADVGKIPDHTIGFIAVCPRISPLTASQVSTAKKLLNIPTPLFDLWRAWDRRGGEESASVNRFVGSGADQSTKRMQLRFNEQSKTDVWRRMAYGLLPTRTENGFKGGLPTADIWAGIDTPVLLLAGEADVITSQEELRKIVDVLKANGAQETRRKTKNNDVSLVANDITESTNASEMEQAPLSILKSARIIKSCVLPDPASHALLFAQSTCRTVSGLIETFLADHVDKRLSLGWQLQHLSTEGKWDVKNLEKWREVAPVSEPIVGVFRAMKTMREVDENHCPTMFAEKWGKETYAICDISHETPVYDPAGLERAGIEYHKLPTVSKSPPTAEEVKSFNEQVDSLRETMAAKGDEARGKFIGVHCHYGFNRTGFFILCYMIDRLGWRLEDALAEFARRRPPGIKHEYFIDTLYARYCSGMRRSSVG